MNPQWYPIIALAVGALAGGSIGYILGYRARDRRWK